MLEYKEVKITRILNPTSIDLGEYVINPFMGCEFACLYCYVRSNRVISRKGRPWGEFVDIRVNAPDLLEREIAVKKPKTVLLGSTTECFQPIERRYGITARTLEILNKHKVYYVILTRSPDIINYLPLLKVGFCKKIYFTVNKFAAPYQAKLEAKSPAFNSRDEAVNILLKKEIPVVPYFSPLLPGVSDIKDIFLKFERAQTIEFECLNFSLNNITEIIDNISAVKPSLRPLYQKMISDRVFYAQVWQELKESIAKQSRETKKGYNIYIHSFGDYFKNTYDKTAALNRK